MAAIPERRWFQFRLRTLLVGVVLIGMACGYVGHELRIATARRNWLAKHVQDGLSDLEVAFLLDDRNAPPDPKIPLVRRWLGDEPVRFLGIRNLGEEAIAKQLFPEAKVVKRFDPKKI